MTYSIDDTVEAAQMIADTERRIYVYRPDGDIHNDPITVEYTKLMNLLAYERDDNKFCKTLATYIRESAHQSDTIAVAVWYNLMNYEHLEGHCIGTAGTLYRETLDWAEDCLAGLKRKFTSPGWKNLKQITSLMLVAREHDNLSALKSSFTSALVSQLEAQGDDDHSRYTSSGSTIPPVSTSQDTHTSDAGSFAPTATASSYRT